MPNHSSTLYTRYNIQRSFNLPFTEPTDRRMKSRRRGRLPVKGTVGFRASSLTSTHSYTLNLQNYTSAVSSEINHVVRSITGRKYTSKVWEETRSSFGATNSRRKGQPNSFKWVPEIFSMMQYYQFDRTLVTSNTTHSKRQGNKAQ